MSDLTSVQAAAGDGVLPGAESGAPAKDADESLYQVYVRNQRRKRRIRRFASGLIGFLVLCLVWQLAAIHYDIQLILPTPVTVVKTFFEILLLREQPWPYGDNIYEHLLTSIFHALIGFAIGGGAALPCGLLVGRVAWFRDVFGPVFKALYPIPGVAWIPLAILWFGLGTEAIIFVVAISTFFPLYYNTEAGVRAINPVLTDVAACFGVSRLGMFVQIILPASVPYLVVGLRIAVADSWRMIVTAEMLAGAVGIGYVLMQSRLFFRSADLLSFMIMISVVGYASERVIVGTLEKWTVKKWEVKPA